MIDIRPANLKDLDWLVGQLKSFAQFYGTKHSFFGDESQARSGISDVIEKHIFLIAEDVVTQPAVGLSAPLTFYERAGFIAGYLSPHIYNPKIRVACEQFWWVAPEWRNGRAGLLLLNAFIKFGTENADIVVLSIIEGRSPINADALTKRGFALHERAYLLEV